MATTSVDVPLMNVNFTSPEVNQDPYPVFEEIRAAGPVVYNELLDRWMVTSHRNCARVLGAVRKFDSHGFVAALKSSYGGDTMEAYDTPRHNDMRSIWGTNFQRDALENQRNVVIKAVAGKIEPFVERVKSGETVDAVKYMTRHIPTLVIADLLGIDQSMIEQFAAWSDAMAGGVEGRSDPSPRGQELIAAGIEATAQINAYVAELIEDRREHPGNDLISSMLASDYAQTGMAEDELNASVTQLVFNGNETTAKFMSTSLVTLARHPEQRRALAQDRSLIPQAIEEIHRWQTLTQSIPRYACSDESDIEGILIPNGAYVMPLQGAANRDPERWEDANAFDISRPAKQHLGFGFGMHVCLGLNLARLEVHVWLNRLLDLLPEYDVVGDIDYGTNFFLRAPTAVYVTASLSSS